MTPSVFYQNAVYLAFHRTAKIIYFDKNVNILNNKGAITK